MNTNVLVYTGINPVCFKYEVYCSPFVIGYSCPDILWYV